MREIPDLAMDNMGTTGTITWVDPEDADGDGWTGDICEVTWDNGNKGDYRTGYEGIYRLRMDPNFTWDPNNNRESEKDLAQKDEIVIGLDIPPEAGQRVIIRKSSLIEVPELLADSGGGPGVITWVDPEDLDGDGIIGDICEVKWDLTNEKGDYRTGYEGIFRLALYREDEDKISKPKTAASATPLRKSTGHQLSHDHGRPDDPWEFLEDAAAEAKRLKKEAELAAQVSLFRFH